MADRPVLDSDVLIDYLRAAGPGHTLVARLRSSLAYRVTAISAVPGLRVLAPYGGIALTVRNGC